jgi:STE24 endopeptidase
LKLRSTTHRASHQLAPSHLRAALAPETPRAIPPVDEKRAKRYSRIRLGLGLLDTTVSLALQAWFALSGTSARLQHTLERQLHSRKLEDPPYLPVSSTAGWAAGLPLDYFGDYQLERSYGLTQQQPAAWFQDRLKALAVGMPIQSLVVTGTYAMIRRYPRDWWLRLSGISVPAMLLTSAIAPVLIAPIFNKFEPLNDPELERRIKNLAEKAGIPIAAIYRMDMSRQTEKANAYFTGIGGSKRIVLGDTLLREFEPDEIEGVIAHELGHQMHRDMWRLASIGAAGITAMLFASSRLVPTVIASAKKRTNVTRQDQIASLPILSLVASGLGALAMPIQAAISRAIERRADSEALQLTGNGEAYARAMARLESQNLSDPNPPKILVWLFYSHPPTSERIAKAKAFAADHS